MNDIDAEIGLVATLKRREMELKYMDIKLKRCKQGSPISPAWARNWERLINDAVSKEVAQYQANRNLNTVPPCCKPVAFQNLPAATQVAQAFSATARRSKSV